MNVEKPDYNERELELVQEFYSNSESDNYFRSFFKPDVVLPGLFVNKFIITQPTKEVAVSSIEKNSFSLGTVPKEIFNNAVAYGNETSVHLLNLAKQSDAYVESFQLVVDWLAVNVNSGYTINKTLNATLYKAPADSGAPENSLDVVFDDALGIVGGRGSVRMQMNYNKSQPLLYTSDNKPIERLPSSVVVYFEGKRFIEYSITGYVAEEASVATTSQRNIGALLCGATSKASRFLCGLKPSGNLFAIGQKSEFVKFTSQQQIRAAVVLYTAKLFCYASIWRVYFAFLNSLGTYNEFVRSGEWKNRPRETATNIEILLGYKDNPFFSAVLDDSQKVSGKTVYIDNNKLTDETLRTAFRNKFAAWTNDPVRISNCITQANRIQAHFFKPTETYEAYAKENLERFELDKTDLEHEFDEIINTFQNGVGTNPNTAKYLGLDTQDPNNGVNLLYGAFQDRFVWTKLNSPVWSVEEVMRRIVSAAEFVQSRALRLMDAELVFQVNDDEFPLYQLLLKLLTGQQLLKAAAYMTNVQLRYTPNRDVAVINAPLRAGERKLAVFAARTLLDALPLERRTAGGKTELFTKELEKLLAENGGNGQVPVPVVEILDLMINRINAMAGVTEDQLIAGFQEFYVQERFYFDDIVHIPWTASTLDDSLLRFAILSSTDRANALFRLNADLILLRNEINKPVDKSKEPNANVSLIVNDFAKIPPLIYGLINNAATQLQVAESGEDRNSSLKIVVLLETALKNIGYYFDNVRLLETRTRVVEVTARYNQFIETEKNVADVLRMFKQEISIPQRVPRLDTNIDDLLDNILSGDLDAIQIDAKIVKPKFLATGLIEPQNEGPVSDLLKKFSSRINSDKITLDEVAKAWREELAAYEAGSIRVDQANPVLQEITWMVQKYATKEQYDKNSPLSSLSQDPQTRAAAQELEREFRDRLNGIKLSLEDIYFRKNVESLFEKNYDSASMVTKLEEFQQKTVNFLRNSLVLLGVALVDTYKKSIKIANKTREFRDLYQSNVGASEKIAELTIVADAVAQLNFVLDQYRKEFDVVRLAVPILDQSKKLYNYVVSALDALRKTLKPEDAQRLDLLTKQSELERLANVKKQIELVRGQLSDTLKELQSTVARAERADSEAAKYDAKLAEFTRNVQALYARIENYGKVVAAAEATLDKIGSTEALKNKIDELEAAFPKFDEGRQTLLTGVPTLLKNVTALKRDIDKLESEMDAVRRQGSQATESFAKTKAYYEEGSKIITANLAEMQTFSDQLKLYQKTSSDILTDATAIRSKVVRDDVETKRIDAELAKLVVQVRGTSRQFDDLLYRVNFAYDNVADITSGNNQRELVKKISDAILNKEAEIKQYIASLPQLSGGAGGGSGIDLATINALINESEQKIRRYIDSKRRRSNDDDDNDAQQNDVVPPRVKDKKLDTPSVKNERQKVNQKLRDIDDDSLEGCLAILGLDTK